MAQQRFCLPGSYTKKAIEDRTDKKFHCTLKKAPLRKIGCLKLVLKEGLSRLGPSFIKPIQFQQN